MKQIKKIKKFFTKAAMAVLPSAIRDEMVRRSVRLPQNLSEDLVFKIAETTEELEASFRLVYESYHALGYCDESELRMRATVYHALPTTTTLIALDKGVVVGTMTMVRDNRLGLPMEKVFDVDCLRKNSNRLAEITSLVIHKDYRREKGGQILFPLLRLMYQYSTSCFGVNHLVVLIHPKDAYFYESLLLFHPIPNTGVEQYLGAPSVVFHLDLQRALIEFERIYSHRNPELNLFEFFVQKKMDNVRMPERRYHKINDPLITPDYLHNVFFKILSVDKDSLERRRIISSVQPDESFDRLPRIEVEAPAILKVKSPSEGQNVEFHVMIKDVSPNGFRAFTHNKISLKHEFEARIIVGPNVIAKVTVEALWDRDNVGVGFKISKSDARWDEFVEFLYQEHFIGRRIS